MLVKPHGAAPKNKQRRYSPAKFSGAVGWLGSRLNEVNPRPSEKPMNYSFAIGFFISIFFSD